MIQEQLVRAAQRGDTVAMNELLDALAPYVGKICGPIALSDGPDAAQEALIAIFRGLRGLENPAAVLNVPAGTAKSRLHRARASFRKAWRS